VLSEDSTTQGYDAESRPAGLHELIRPLFEEAGAALAATDPASGARIRQATTHVLRHTHATHALDRGVPVSVAQRNLGHSSLVITSHYLSVDEDQRHADTASPRGRGRAEPRRRGGRLSLGRSVSPAKPSSH
jgi:hypothetical protein